MDVRNVIFPMTARDLVQSAVIVGVQKRGDGAEVYLLEVEDVLAAPDEGSDAMLQIEVIEQVTRERATLELFPDTPLLVTGIRRR